MNYLGVKKTSLSEIPDGWEMEELNNILMIVKDKYTPDKKEDICCLELEHFEQRTGIINGWCSSSTQASVKNAFKKGQVLFGKLRPYLQKYWLADFDGVCSSEIWVLTSKDKKTLDNRYLFRMVQMHRFIQAANVSFGSKMPRSDWEYMANIPFPLPPLPEQQRIATILSTWDKAIAKEQQLIKTLEIRHRALMQQLLSGKKRLKGFKDEWKAFKFEDVLAKITNGVTYDTENTIGIPVTRIETISSGIINFSKIGYAEQFANQEDYRLKYGDILYSHINSLSHIGKTAIYLDEKPLYHGMNLLLLRVNDNADRNFIYYWLNSKAARKVAQSLAKPAVNQASISATELKRILLDLPTLPEQTAIAAMLSTSDNEIQIHRRRLEALQQQKKGLMQVLLTGKVRVKI
ncbi:type I restriction enzyme S subunit [Filimonas zeae]|nr:restriction endonuclease subunit S [Filimonas zeae]MDR6337573.1 type I restriction enzyme S subunit [Filimonas zeae]